MTSNQSTAGWCLRMWSKWTDRRPTPRPRLACPRRGGFIRLLPGRRENGGPGCIVPGRLSALRSAARSGGGAELLAGLLHRRLVARPGLLPAVALDRHRAAPLAFAGVVAGAALALAFVAAGAAMGRGGGARALARAIVLAAGAQALAVVEAAAGVSVLGRLLLLVRREQAAAQQRAGDDAAERRQRQLAEISPTDV